MGPGVFKNVVCLRQLITSLSRVYSAITWEMFQSSYHNQGKCNISCYQFDMPRFYEWVGIETEKCTETFVQLISRRTKSSNLVTLEYCQEISSISNLIITSTLVSMGAPKKKSRAAACVRIVTGNNYKSMCSRKWFARAFQLFSKVKVETSLEMVWPLVLHPKLPGQKAIPYTEKEKKYIAF